MLTLPIKKKWFDMILSKEKKEEYIKLYDVSCDVIDFDRYECLKILCEEILSKIEKSDK